MKFVSVASLLIGGVVAIPSRFPRNEHPFLPQMSNIFSFGDSYTTVGYNVNGLQPNSSNPIGNPAFPGKTTSGGNNWIDYLITQDNRTVSLAYDFAVAGATVDSSLVAPYTTSVKSLVQQVVYFKNHYSASSTIWNSTNSLFPIWFGINDIMNGYFSAPGNWTVLAPLVVAQYFTQAQILYDLGARRIMFLTVPPIQKTPQVLAANSTTQQQVVYAMESFNHLLQIGYEQFRRTNNESITWLFNTTRVFDKVLADPVAYGSPDATCYNGNGISCLWWNAFHPGQAIHKQLASKVANLTRF